MCIGNVAIFYRPHPAQVFPVLKVMRMNKITFLAIAIVFSISLVGGENIRASDLDMTSPEATMHSYYKALKSNNYYDFKRLHTDGGFVVSESTFSELSRRITNYAFIINKEVEAGVAEPPRRFIQVREIYEGNNDFSLMNYSLIKSGQLWKIELYNADEGPPVNIEDIEKQMKDMFN